MPKGSGGKAYLDEKAFRALKIEAALRNEDMQSVASNLILKGVSERTLEWLNEQDEKLKGLVDTFVEGAQLKEIKDEN
jgi:hypothetical protein